MIKFPNFSLSLSEDDVRLISAWSCFVSVISCVSSHIVWLLPAGFCVSVVS